MILFNTFTDTIFLSLKEEITVLYQRENITIEEIVRNILYSRDHCKTLGINYITLENSYLARSYVIKTLTEAGFRIWRLDQQENEEPSKETSC